MSSARFARSCCRAGEPLDEYGLATTVSLIAAQHSQLDEIVGCMPQVRAEPIDVLLRLDYGLADAVLSAGMFNAMRRELSADDRTVLNKLDALANDTRGNANERANAKVMADKLRKGVCNA